MHTHTHAHAHTPASVATYLLPVYTVSPLDVQQIAVNSASWHGISCLTASETGCHTLTQPSLPLVHILASCVQDAANTLPVCPV